MDTTERVKNVIAEEMGTPIANIEPRTRVISDLGADSLDMTELLLGLQEEFVVDISDPDWEAMGPDPTVDQICEFVKRYVHVEKRD